MSNLNCPIKAVPLKPPTTSVSNFTHYMHSNAYKTIYQGQPTNLEIYNVTATSATVRFTKVGNPFYYELYVKAHGRLVTLKIYSNVYDISDLTPDTLYDVNVIAYYKSGDLFRINETKLFHTDSKYQVTSISTLYPSNEVFHYDADADSHVDVSFNVSPGSPSEYGILVNGVFQYSHIQNHTGNEKYRIKIIKNQVNLLNVVTYYSGFANGYYSQPQTTITHLPESGSIINATLYGSKKIDLHYTAAEGSPTYILNLSSTTFPLIKKQVDTYSAPGIEVFDSLSANTTYSIFIETIYPNTLNSYFSNVLTVTTPDEVPLENVNCKPSNDSLLFFFDPPSDLFLSSPLSEYNVRLTQINSNITIYDSSRNNTTTTLEFHGLLPNTEYQLEIKVIYDTSTDISYRFTETFKTLHEGPVEQIAISNITGTSFQISFQPFPSQQLPEYFSIRLKSTESPEVIEATYENNHSVTNLHPNRNYTVDVTAVYFTNNSYEQGTPPLVVSTLREGPIKTIALLDVKGDYVEVMLSFYDLTEVTIPLSINILPFYTSVYLDISACMVISYSSSSVLVKIPLSFHNTAYSITFDSVYAQNTYKNAIDVFTPDEYPVNLVDEIYQFADSFHVYKKNANNQDKYVVHFPKIKNWATTFSWSNKTYLYVEMSKDGQYIYLCPTGEEIQVYKLVYDVNNFNMHEHFELVQTLNDIPWRIFSIKTNASGSRFILGFNNDTVLIYEDGILSETIQMEHDISSRNVFMSDDGTVCAVSDGSITSGIFIYHIDLHAGLYLFPTITTTYNPLPSLMNKLVSFDASGKLMAIAYETLWYADDGAFIKGEGKTRIYDLSASATTTTFDYIERVFDNSGNNVTLSSDGTTFATVMNNDTIHIYNIHQNSIFLDTILHSHYSVANMEPVVKSISLSSNGMTLAVGDNLRGQVFIYDKKNTQHMWEQRGNTLEVLSAEEFGFYSKINDDGSKLVVGTKPTFQEMDRNFYGTVNYYVWENKAIVVEKWPIVVENLIPNTTYEFIISSYYNGDLSYSYDTHLISVIADNSDAGVKPYVQLSVYNNMFDISWNPVEQRQSHSIYYTLVLSSLNEGVIEEKTYDFSGRDSIKDLSYDADYRLEFYSHYKSDTSITKQFEGFNSIIHTLNETEVDIFQNVLYFDSQTKIVFKTDNKTDNIKNNILYLSEYNSLYYDISRSIPDYSYNNSYIWEFDVSNNRISGMTSSSASSSTTDISYALYIVTSYNQTVQNDPNVEYVTRDYISDILIFNTYSYTSVDNYIQNGTFSKDMANLNPDDKRGIYRITPAEWGNSTGVYLVDNNSIFRTEKIMDISYHALLFRGLDETGVVNDLNQVIDIPLYPQYYILSFFIANYGTNTDKYTRDIYCSNEIKYSISITNEKNEVWYDSGEIVNADVSWNRISIKIPKSKTSFYDSIFSIKRLSNEYNNLFVSDIAMSSQPDAFDNEPISLYFDTFSDTKADISWNSVWLSQSVHLLSNFSLSFWVYLHDNSNMTLYRLFNIDDVMRIEVQNNTMTVTNQLTDGTHSNIVTIDMSTTSMSDATHIFLTYSTTEVLVYKNGVLHKNVTPTTYFTLPTQKSTIYFGGETQFGVVTKQFGFYDHQVEASDVKSIYTLSNAQFDVGNKFMLEKNRQMVTTGDSGTNPTVNYQYKNSRFSKKIVSTKSIIKIVK